MLIEALRKVVATLDQLGVPYALIGGLALATRGVVRATKDVDLLVDWNLRGADALVQSFNQNNFPATFRRGPADDPVPGLIRVAISAAEGPVRCDLLFASAAWQADAVRNAAPVDLQGFVVRVAQAGDLFVLKLHAGGPMDLFDAAHLYELQTEGERALWKERATQTGHAKAFAECLKSLRRGR